MLNVGVYRTHTTTIHANTIYTLLYERPETFSNKLRSYLCISDATQYAHHVFNTFKALGCQTGVLNFEVTFAY